MHLAKRLVVVLATVLFAQGLLAQQSRVFLSGGTPVRSTDATKPVPRGYITVEAESAVGGANIFVDVFHDRATSKCNLSLQIVISSAKGTYVVPIKLLEKDVTPPAGYFQQRQQYHVDYAEIQAMFNQLAPNAPSLQIGPGTPLFVKADFHAQGTEHNWGGPDRGGGFFLPNALDANGNVINVQPVETQARTVGVARPTELDLAYPINAEMTNIFNDHAKGSGLKLNGQVRSRLEGEGKFQLTQAEYARVKALMFELAADPTKAAQVLGPDWTLKLEDRYMTKDSAGQVIKGADGFPVPDPMVDTYYDSKDMKAAQNDMAFRYRWTEGNATGSWNFKPGIGRTDAQGVMYRVEFGVDTTDDKPSTISKFADSMHPLNPFAIIRNVLPGSTPSEFLLPAVKIEDHRYKFKLTRKDGLAIEVSVDDVKAHNLRGSKGESAQFYQLEMDIDHLSTASNRVVNANSGGLQYLYAQHVTGKNANGTVQTQNLQMYRWVDVPEAQQAIATHLEALDATAFIDGRPVLHGAEDLDPSGPLLTSRAQEFADSSLIISKLRDHVVGPQWRAGAQKYAFGAAVLKLVPASKRSNSVKAVRDLVQVSSAGIVGMCRATLSK